MTNKGNFSNTKVGTMKYAQSIPLYFRVCSNTAHRRAPMRNNTVINQTLMKEKNRRLVAYTLWRNSPISRTGLAKTTGLNKATITNIVAELKEEGMVKCCGSLQGNVGRAQNLIMFNEDYGMCGSIIIRPNTIILAVGNLRAKILWSKELHFSTDELPTEVIKCAATQLDDGIKACEGKAGKLIGIGVGTASLLRHDDDMLYAIHSIDWHNISVLDYLRHCFNVPILADTVANCSAVGEKYFGIADDKTDMIYLSVGYGIGAGIIVNGKQCRGSEGFAGDIGHMVIDPNGPQCSCGKKGCWEVIASSIAANETFKSLSEKAETGDVKAISTLNKIGCNLGIGISNLINILNPQLVVLGGEVVNAGKWVMNPCRSTVQERVWPWVMEHTRIEFTGVAGEYTAGTVGTMTKVIEYFLE